MLTDIIHTNKFVGLFSHIWFLAEGIYSEEIRNWKHFRHFSNEDFFQMLTKWDIEDRDSFASQTAWLLSEGYRAEYDKLSAKITTFPYESRSKYASTAPFSKQEQDKIYIVMKYQDCIGRCGILAYDYITYIALLYIGNTLNIINSQQYTTKSAEAAKVLQKSYSSWDECLIACIAGSLFQGSEQYYKNFELTQEDYIKVLNILHSKSSMPWDSKLK